MRRIGPLVAIAALAGCGGSVKFDSSTAPKIGACAKGVLAVKLTEVGAIEPESRVEVKSLLGGKVREVRAQPGETVAAGHVLALIEPDVDQIRNLSQLRTSLAKARLELRNSEIDRRNIEELAAKNFASAEDVREAERRHESARVDYQTLEAQVKILAEGGIPLPGEGASPRLEAFRIIAPSAGVILESRIEPGEVVTSGTFAFGGGGSPLFVLADLGKLVIKATVNEVDIAKVAVDQKVTVTVDAFRGESFEGRVTRISPGARPNERVRVFDLQVKVADPATRLRPGMTANLDIHGEVKEGALKVPIESVFRKKGKDIVYVSKKLTDAEKKKRMKELAASKTPIPTPLNHGYDFEEREVKTGLVSIEEIEIVSGLKDGDGVFLEDPTVPKKASGGFN